MLVKNLVILPGARVCAGAWLKSSGIRKKPHIL